MMNAFLKRMKIELPIIQAPMAGVSTPAMAAAVSNSGALGSIGVGNADADTARKMIRDVRAGTNRPFNVNLFCHQPALADPVKESAWIKMLAPYFAELDAEPPTALREIYATFLTDDDMFRMLHDERPPIVSFHFGIPSAEKIHAMKSAGIVLLATATSLSEAVQIERAGIDAIVAQGYEAGGHRGVFDPQTHDDRMGTMALTRVLVHSCRVPIISAGGIMDGSGIAASIALGASAAQLGTAFILCPESIADQGYRAAMISDSVNHTIMTRAISGRLARSLANRITAFGEYIDQDMIPSYPIAYDLGKALHTVAKAKGEFGYGAQWAGQSAPLARELPAGDLIARLSEELKTALTRFPKTAGDCPDFAESSE